MTPRNRYKTPLDISPIREDTRAALKAVLNQLPGRALEIGCGTGYLSIELAKRGWEATGTDISQDALSVSIENARSESVSAHFVRSDLFSHTEGRFDAVVFNPPLIFSSNVLYLYARGAMHHIPTLNNLLEAIFSRFPYHRRKELITRFIEQVKPHLTPRGYAYLIAFQNEFMHISRYARRFETFDAGRRSKVVRIPRDALKVGWEP